ncbi:hypothetical protein RB614_01585 [Phytohabitans sp. ZYX-F-186]|uniref:PknH-like extracellular domain-containing protein n=1 Tax=Phytohabitans maris TaxID=3071409 RepID=A0ABU0Z830_9ACTN|nr:hypothetical protein [Phytohabitans sp. ZYX-F-186]MDQ7903210.1 hypothetical protein [Phytohabitans sp. ZYX-F-186]
MPRFRMIAGGVALGGALAAVLATAGVIDVPVHQRDRPAAPSPSALAGPLTATQPELAEALLAQRDLPEGYRPAPAPQPTPVEDTGRTEGCRALFERPWDVAGAGARDRAVGDYAGGQRATLLREALALFGPGGAARAVGELRRASGSCPEFDARLEDGTAVRVQLRDMALRRVGDEAYAVSVTARPLGRRDASGTRHGYLAVGRLGPVLSVLRHLGPAGSADPGQVAAMLTRALRRAAPLVPRDERRLTGHDRRGVGKMEPCRLCASPSPR